MSTLTITKAYNTGAALTEAHLDNFRSGLLTLFNTAKFEAANFSTSMVIPSAKFLGNELTSTDNAFIYFGTGSDAWMGLDSSKNLVFDTAASTTDICFYAGATNYLEIYTDKVHVPGDIKIGEGGTSKTILQAFSYKKPVLEWNSSTSVSLSCNSASSDESVVYFPTFVAAVDEVITTGGKYRVADVTDTANGYGGSHTGAASGGRRVGLSLTTNAWYAVYICKLRSGDDYDASTAKFILVFDDTLPTSANESTIDARYGQGNWVYAGIIRYGFGASGSNSSIPKFKQSNKGWCSFYEKSTGHAGIVLANDSLDTDNTASAFYTLTSGMSGQVVPSTIGKVSLNVVRDYVSEWYIKDANALIVWRGGRQTVDTDKVHGHYVEMPFFTGTCYSFHQSRKLNGAVSKSVCLIGFCDTMITARGQGKI